MNKKFSEVLYYLSSIDKLSKKDYDRLISIYGIELVHECIDYMIDQSEDNIVKFDYYIDKLTNEFDNFSYRSTLDIYMQDISRIPMLSREENKVYSCEAYNIVNELKEIFSKIGFNYVKQVGVVFNSIVDELDFYLRECEDIELLDRLKKLYSKYIDVRDKLVKGNIRVVVAASKNYYRDSSSFMEIIQWGNIGMMMAVEKYNPNFNTRFVTYSYYWIKQAIRHMNRFEGNVATTISYIAMEKNTLRLEAINVLSNKFGRTPTNEEIASYMGISDKRLEELEGAFKDYISLSSKVSISSGEERGSVYADLFEDTSVNIEKTVFLKFLRYELMKVMDEVLNDKQKFILLNRFGFCGKILSLQQIGDIYGVSRQDIEQLQKRALRKIRRLAGSRLKDFLD